MNIISSNSYSYQLVQEVKALLSSCWNYWKGTFIQNWVSYYSSYTAYWPTNNQTGRVYCGVYRPAPVNATVQGYNTEHQSFAMMFSVWFNDKTTFDLVWSWTKTNLRLRSNDKLFWWAKYDSDAVLGAGTATDGDIGIAYALILAYEKWGQQSYLDDALLTIPHIYQYASATCGSLRIIAGGANDPSNADWWNNSKGLMTFTNYMMIHPFRKFAQYDTARTATWGQIISDSFTIINAASALWQHGHPPEAFRVNFSTGAAVSTAVYDSSWNQQANVSSYRYLTFILYDAYNGGTESLNYCTSWQKLETHYAANQTLPWGWRDGQTWGPECWPLLCLLTSKVFMTDPVAAKVIYDNKVKQLFNPIGLWGRATNDDFQLSCAMLALMPITGYVL